MDYLYWHLCHRPSRIGANGVILFVRHGPLHPSRSTEISKLGLDGRLFVRPRLRDERPKEQVEVLRGLDWGGNTAQSFSVLSLSAVLLLTVVIPWTKYCFLIAFCRQLLIL